MSEQREQLLRRNNSHTQVAAQPTNPAVRGDLDSDSMPMTAAGLQRDELLRGGSAQLRSRPSAAPPANAVVHDTSFEQLGGSGTHSRPKRTHAPGRKASMVVAASEMAMSTSAPVGSPDATGSGLHRRPPPLIPASLNKRLRDFLAAYDPARIEQADGLSIEYEGREEDLNGALRRTYGDDLPTSIGQPSLHSRLVQYYTHHAPDKIATVEEIQRVYAGAEEQLIRDLFERYGALLPSGTQVPLQRRLLEFYRTHAPEKAKDVPFVAFQFEGAEEILNSELIDRYGAGLSSASAVRSLKERLFDFYQVHAPHKLNYVDDIAAGYEGREEELNESLLSIYSDDLPTSFGLPSLHKRLAAFYQQERQHRPKFHGGEVLGKRELISAIAIGYQGHEEELNCHLRDLYNDDVELRDGSAEEHLHLSRTAFRARLLYEILDSERDFVAQLLLLQESLVIPCRHRAAVLGAAAVRTMDDIFLNWAELCQAHTLFLSRLEALHSGDDVAHVLQESLALLEAPYLTYMRLLKAMTGVGARVTLGQKISAAMQTFDWFGMELLSFFSHLDHQGALDTLNEQDLAAYLHKPLRRMERYGKLVTGVLDCTRSGDYYSLNALDETRAGVVDISIDASRAGISSSSIPIPTALCDETRLTMLQNSFAPHQSCHVDLVKPGRRLLKEGTLMRVHWRRWQERHVFLFTDLVLLGMFGVPNRGFVISGSIELDADCRVQILHGDESVDVEADSGGCSKHRFKVVSSSRTEVFFAAPTAQSCVEWVSMIDTTLTRLEQRVSVMDWDGRYKQALQLPSQARSRRPVSGQSQARALSAADLWKQRICRCRAGDMVWKFRNRDGRAEQRFLRLSIDSRSIEWGHVDGADPLRTTERVRSSQLLDDVQYISHGAASKSFHKFKAGSLMGGLQGHDPRLCFSIATGLRTLDFATETPEPLARWIIVLQFLRHQTPSSPHFVSEQRLVSILGDSEDREPYN